MQCRKAPKTIWGFLGQGLGVGGEGLGSHFEGPRDLGSGLGFRVFTE